MLQLRQLIQQASNPAGMATYQNMSFGAATPFPSVPRATPFPSAPRDPPATNDLSTILMATLQNNEQGNNVEPLELRQEVNHGFRGL